MRQQSFHIAFKSYKTLGKNYTSQGVHIQSLPLARFELKTVITVFITLYMINLKKSYPLNKHACFPKNKLCVLWIKNSIACIYKQTHKCYRRSCRQLKPNYFPYNLCKLYLLSSQNARVCKRM